MIRPNVPPNVRVQHHVRPPSALPAGLFLQHCKQERVATAAFRTACMCSAGAQHEGSPQDATWQCPAPAQSFRHSNSEKRVCTAFASPAHTSASCPVDGANADDSSPILSSHGQHACGDAGTGAATRVSTNGTFASAVPCSSYPHHTADQAEQALQLFRPPPQPPDMDACSRSAVHDCITAPHLPRIHTRQQHTVVAPQHAPLPDPACACKQDEIARVHQMQPADLRRALAPLVHTSSGTAPSALCDAHAATGNTPNVSQKHACPDAQYHLKAHACDIHVATARQTACSILHEVNRNQPLPGRHALPASPRTASQRLLRRLQGASGTRPCCAMHEGYQAQAHSDAAAVPSTKCPQKLLRAFLKASVKSVKPGVNMHERFSLEQMPPSGDRGSRATCGGSFTPPVENVACGLEAGRVDPVVALSALQAHLHAQDAWRAVETERKCARGLAAEVAALNSELQPMRRLPECSERRRAV